MAFKSVLGLVAIVLLNSILVNCQLTIDNGLDAKQKEIIRNYESVANLNYGDKCNYDLESKGNKVRENVKPFLKKLLTSAFKHGVSGNNDEFELSSSLEDAQEEIFIEIEEYTTKIQKSTDGVTGICNDTNTLYCDREVGECRCGKTKTPKGFSFAEVDGTCKFDIGSGCVQSEFSELTAMTCKKGSNCVTVIDNLKCTFANSLVEGIRYPTRFQKLVQMQGYTCFCDKE